MACQCLSDYRLNKAVRRKDIVTYAISRQSELSYVDSGFATNRIADILDLYCNSADVTSAKVAFHNVIKYLDDKGKKEFISNLLDFIINHNDEKLSIVVKRYCSKGEAGFIKPASFFYLNSSFNVFGSISPVVTKSVLKLIPMIYAFTVFKVVLFSRLFVKSSYLT